MRKLIYSGSIFILSVFGLLSCDQQGSSQKTVREEPSYVAPKREEIKYTLVNTKDSGKALLKKYTSEQQVIVNSINRVDNDNIAKLDTIIVPDRFIDIMQYSPYPFYIAELKDVNKIVFFSYPIQAFAAYEKGKLVKWGPTNMGRQKDPTPTGLFFTNWKAEQTTSTFNDEWDLKWNFNIENKLGVGWHQYALPGYPASHSCLRMLEADAKFMYDWADEWVLKGTDDVQAQGTPVIVFGAYPFGGPKPWLALAANPHALDISEETLKNEFSSDLQKIMQEQRKREGIKPAAGK